jgi:rhomboid protease GluP
MGHDLGFITLVVYGCSALYILGLALTVMLGGDIMGGGNPLGMLSAHPLIDRALGASGASPVFGDGMWWTVLSAGWLHGGALHILFNMMSVRNLGPPTAELYGPARMVIIYTAGSAAGFALSSCAGLLRIPFFGSGLTLGASAPIFGLIGALFYYGRRTGSSLIHSQAKSYLFGLVIAGFIIPGIDNAAHVGGFIGGYLAGMWLDPQREERIGHMLTALACLLLTALAVITSMIKFLPYLIR